MSLLEIKDIKRDFRLGSEVLHVLKGINLTIEKGEYVALMGPSGSGKSTLMNILGCLDRPSSGDYILDGISVKDMSKNELAHIRNTKIGFIFQSYNLLARTSAIENVELPLMYNPKVSAKERRERAIEALISVGLESRLNHLPSELSGGQQQRVAIARSLVNQPVILLADEATGNLDTKTSYEVMELFQRLNDQGSTIGFVTHEDDIAQFSKRTVVLKDGHIISDKQVTDRLNAKEQLAQLQNTNDGVSLWQS
mgnify:CR=1 FL=1